MRKIILAVAVAAASGGMAAAQTTQWQYGAGNGDPIQYAGPKPTYSFAYGAGNGDPVTSTGKPQSSYAYGGENQTGGMVQMATPAPAVTAQAPAPTVVPRQQMAAPATSPSARPGNHS